MDAFKVEFKRYKQRKPPPDLSDVIDFQRVEKWKERICVHSLPVTSATVDSDDVHGSLGLKHCDDWKVYSIKENPDFLFIVNPFTDGSQWHWVKQCLQVYSCKPNISNLDAHMEIKDSIWDMSINSNDSISQIILSLEKGVKKGEGRSSFQKSAIYKLRWVTLGYHYNWNTKTYDQHEHSEFPADLVHLFSKIAKSFGFHNFCAEAGIINYYHLDSTLSGHTDHSELDLTAPLFSLSFGQPAIFLLGGKTRDVVPVAMYVRSGDIMVMAGKSRLAYHAVPRILAPNKEELLPSCLNPCLQNRNDEVSAKSSKEEQTIKQEVAEKSGRSQLEQEERKNLNVSSIFPSGIEEENREIKRTKLDEANVMEANFLPQRNDDLTSRIHASFARETELMKLYLASSRINVNVRQVLEQGKDFGSNNMESGFLKGACRI